MFKVQIHVINTDDQLSEGKEKNGIYADSFLIECEAGQFSSSNWGVSVSSPGRIRFIPWSNILYYDIVLDQQTKLKLAEMQDAMFPVTMEGMRNGSAK